MYKINTFQTISSKFTQEIVIGGRTLELYIYWNVRAQAWYMDITDLSDPDVTDQYITSIRLVPNWMLLRQYKSYLPSFNGNFFVKQTDEALNRLDITYDSLGNGWDLMYVTDVEAEEWEDEYGLG